MKNNLVKLLLASSLVVTGLAAEDMTTQSTDTETQAPVMGKYAGDNGLYVGGTIGGGSGSWSYETDTTSYSFDDDDGLSTSDMKFYVGKRSVYAFIQMGTITPDHTTSPAINYTAVGIGYLGRLDSMRVNFEAGSLTPEFNAEIAFDTATSASEDFGGLLLSADLGVAVSLVALPVIEFTANIGYDLHVLNVSDTASGYYGYIDDHNGNGTGSFNFSALNFTVGAKYNF